MFVRVEFRGTGVGKALGFLSPGYTLWGTHIAPYSPVSQPVSGLGLGPTAPFMNAAFVLSGIHVFVHYTGIVGEGYRTPKSGVVVCDDARNFSVRRQFHELAYARALLVRVQENHAVQAVKQFL